MTLADQGRTSTEAIADPELVLAAGDRNLVAAAEALGIAVANLHPH